MRGVISRDKVFVHVEVYFVYEESPIGFQGARLKRTGACVEVLS